MFGFFTGCLRVPCSRPEREGMEMRPQSTNNRWMGSERYHREVACCAVSDEREGPHTPHTPNRDLHTHVLPSPNNATSVSPCVFSLRWVHCSLNHGAVQPLGHVAHCWGGLLLRTHSAIVKTLEHACKGCLTFHRGPCYCLLRTCAIWIDLCI